MAQTLADLARALDWRATVIDGASFAAADAGEHSMVLVATQGHGDEEALMQAIAARPAYVGLVGSHRRGAAVLGYLASGACPPTSSAGCGSRPELTSAGCHTARSRSLSWPSLSSCARPPPW